MVNVNACRFTFPGISFCSAERQPDEQCRTDRQHGFEHTFGEYKVRAVLIYDRLDFAGMRFLRKTSLNTANVFRGIPKRIILRTDKQQSAADILNLYEFLPGDRVRRFGVVKQLTRGYWRLVRPYQTGIPPARLLALVWAHKFD